MDHLQRAQPGSPRKTKPPSCPRLVSHVQGMVKNRCSSRGGGEISGYLFSEIPQFCPEQRNWITREINDCGEQKRHQASYLSQASTLSWILVNMVSVMMDGASGIFRR